MTEIKSLDDLAKHFPDDEDTLVALDIDQTLIRSLEYVGSEPWYDERIRHWQQSGLSEVEAVYRANEEWERAQKTDSVVCVERSTASYLKKWQDRRDLKVMALTARRWEIAELTQAQLKHAGLAFDQGVPFSLPLTLSSETKYERGILYVGPMGDKAASLSGFLARLPKPPTFIAFIDDRPGHVARMSEFAEALGIAYFAARYSGADTAFQKRRAG